MHRLETLDWWIIIAYLVLSLAVGLYYSRRAGKGMDEFFLSGRSLPWWLAGTSMIATSFASDTPLWVTDLVRRKGVDAAWFFWAPGIGMILGVFLFAKLWRRSRVMTDVEMIELRYSGKAAAGLRFYQGAFGALVMNSIIQGWVILAMAKICQEGFGLDKVWSVSIALAVAVIYTVTSGLWGVIITDFVQYIIATGCTIALAFVSVSYIGGFKVLWYELHRMDQWSGHNLNILPSVGSGGTMSIMLFIAYFGVMWMMTAGQGGYQAQRILASRTERDASLSVMWLSVGYYALNAWPWIIVALVSLLIFPNLTDHQAAYPKMMMQVAPTGLRGGMVVAMAAAFMSTASTLLNWGASYLTNDVYRRFLAPNATQKHYVLVSRLAMVVMAILGGIVAVNSESIVTMLQLVMTLGIGTVVAGLAMWFWWRPNALSAIVVAATSAVVTIAMYFLLPDWRGEDFFGHRLLINLGVSTLIWFVSVMLSTPTDMEKLCEFYNRVQPPGIWGPVEDKLGIKRKGSLWFWQALLSWGIGVAFVYGLLIGIGCLLLGSKITVFGTALSGTHILIFAAVMGYWTSKRLPKKEVVNVDEQTT